MIGKQVFDVLRGVFLFLLFSCSAVCGAAEQKRLCTFFNKTIGSNNKDHEDDDIIIDGCTVTVNGPHRFNSLTIINGGKLTCSEESGVSLLILGDLIVGDDASVDLDGKGYPPGYGPGAGGDGKNAGGGGHGGNGGAGDANAVGGQTYDSETEPSMPGSGGGYGVHKDKSVDGGYGGGSILIAVRGELQLNGRISANGTSGQTYEGYFENNLADYGTCLGGGGAGGSIYIEADMLSGAGSITADGGNGGYLAPRQGRPTAVAGAGGGGGGRIVLRYATPSAFSGTLSVQGGTDGSSASAMAHRGAEGTRVVERTSAIGIKSPPAGSAHVAGEDIQFEADPNGPPSFPYMWSSVRKEDGQSSSLGTGPSLVARLSAGAYTITLSQTDKLTTLKETIDLVVVPRETAYSAGVQANFETAPAGTPVTFAGQATWTINDKPAGNMEVVVHVTTQGMERKLPAVRTDQDGRFETVWQPLGREAGRYLVWADRPDVVDEPAEDEFVLFGAAIEPNAVDHRVLAGQRIERSVTIRNLGDAELAGLSARVENAPANLIIEPNCPKILGPKSAAPLKYSVKAADASVHDAEFDIVVSREQTPVATLHVHVDVVSLAAVLAAYPHEITAGMVRGDQTLLDVEVVNLGGAPSDVLTICLPADVPWMSLVTPETVGPLEPNESTTVTLSLRPEATTPLEPCDGNLVVSDGQAELSVPFHLDCVSASVSDLIVTAVDELTFYAPGEPKLAGAHVQVVDAGTGRAVGSADANDSGVAEFSGLPDAYYNVEVTAPDHETFHTLLGITAGGPAQLTAFLPRRLVMYRWTVLPSQVGGRFSFEVEADSVAGAPVPVVTVDPLLLKLCDLPQEDVSVTYTFTNHGLLDARDVKLVFREFAGFDFTPLVDTIDLPAGASVEVPVHIHSSDISAGLAGPCDDSSPCAVGQHEVSYRLRCGQDDLLYKTPFFAKAFCDQLPCGAGIIGTGPGVDIAGGGPVDLLIPCPLRDARARFHVDKGTILVGDVFTATLEIDDDSRTTPLENVKIALTICDDEGAASEYLFDIEPPQVTGIEDVSGTGSLAPSSSLAAEWPITAAPQAACGEPQHYDISGELTYIVSGAPFRTILYPVRITLLPNPQLTVKYFLERDVRGDDPLTDSIEPTAPFSLGMMVSNHGCGAAGDVQVVSAQPRIVGDDPDRPNEFKIVGTRIGRDAIAPVLNVGLGDIQPESNVVVQWLMQSSLQGWFEDYKADFMRVDSLGDKRLAMVGETPIYELSHVVRAIGPNDDGIPDFLTNSPDTHLPDAIHLSDGSVQPVASIPDPLSEIAILGDHVYLTVLGVPASYFYIQFPGASLSGSPLKAATRSDGVEIPVGENVWTSQRLVHTQGQPAHEESLLCLFDHGGPGAYILDYTGLPRLKAQAEYFLERRIYGDDPVTQAVEPPVPFSLGLIVRNQGYATAKNVWIIASPPEIVDAANQRLPDPGVVAVSVGSNSVSPSLQIGIGDLQVNESEVIHWVMQSAFQGTLENWSVELVQVDDLGVRYPLDVNSVSIHDMEHAVRAIWSGDDGACDFLTYEGQNTYGLPDTLYLSDGSVWPESVTGLVRMVHELTRIKEHVQFRLAVVGVPDGPFYVRYPDPTEGKLKLVAVTRSDGVSIAVGPNAWTTHRTVRQPPWQPYDQNLLYLFDYGGPGSYTFEYELGDWQALLSDEP
jgi:hypothetical protein